MGLFSWLRGAREGAKGAAGAEAARPAPAAPLAQDEGWESVPFYVPAPADERARAAVCAVAIAAGDRPNSEFRVRSVEVANPEARRVAAIATAIAANDRPESQFVVRHIWRKS